MLTCKHSKFTLPKRITYLNCAYMSPLLKSVEKAGIRALRAKRNPTEILPVDFFTDAEALRQEFAKLIHAPDAKRIAIIPSVSYGMATVAKNLKIGKGENIVVASEQFPSNVYPWQTLCNEAGATVLNIEPDKTFVNRGKDWNQKILENITAKTKAVAIEHTHWADGTKFDLEAIRKKTTEVGAMLIVDGTQSVGALPFDVQKIKPDALICAAYKWMMGPYAIGMAYYSERFDGGKPLEENWINRLNSEDFSGLVNYQPEYQPGALRYDVGERSNFILVPMLLKAITELNRWGVDNIQQYCFAISSEAVAKLREKDFWIEDDNYRGGHLFGVRAPKEVNFDKVKEELVKNNIYVSFRGDAIRISPNVYNDEKDLKKLVKILTRHI